ncbi:MAG: outer membrane lipoprotein chaperone LolA [Gammaproteobacteria bacterium]
MKGWFQVLCRRRAATLLLVAGLCFAGPIAARADSGMQRLDRFFDGLKTLQADFDQQVLGQHGGVLQQAVGQLWISRPDRFRWDYTKPYRQVIVADGTNLWTYDDDLQQATVKPLSEALVGTPATLLSGEAPPEKLFKVSDAGSRDGDQWVELVPRSRNSHYQSIRLGFNARTLDRMEMVDAFGQTTLFRFSNVQRNIRVSASRFHFKPPAGADVIGTPQ